MASSTLQSVQHPGTPTIAAGVGAGTGTVAIVAGSSDLVGKITSTPNADDTTGVLFTVTFAKAFRSAPAAVLISPEGVGLQTANYHVSSITTTAFAVTANVDPGGGSLACSYVVIPSDGE